MKPGTWIRIAWLDAEPSTALFLGYVGGSKRDGNYRSDYKGDRSIECLYINGDTTRQHSRAVHTQVIEIMGHIEAPK